VIRTKLIAPLPNFLEFEKLISNLKIAVLPAYLEVIMREVKK